jgi:hypothetical protein
MNCIFLLFPSCHVLENICKENEDLCKELKKMYGKKEFLREYCSMCIKSVYASRFIKGKIVVVNTL